MATGIERFQSSIGEIVWDHGFTTPDTAEKMYDVMDLQRACQLYLWSLSIVGQAQWRSAYRENFPSFAENSFVLAQSYEGRLGVLTVNQTSEYFFGWTNVQHRAAILEIPAGVVVGLVTDMWQRGLTDVGWFGPNTGTGGTYVISGPETARDAIPDIKGATLPGCRTTRFGRSSLSPSALPPSGRSPFTERTSPTPPSAGAKRLNTGPPAWVGSARARRVLGDDDPPRQVLVLL